MNTIILAQTAAALKVIENIRAGALRRFTQTVSLACCTVLFSNFSLAASIAGLHFMHKDWELACDNTGTCRAAGYQADEHLDRPVSVLLLRAAGANTSIAARLKIDAEHLAGQRKALTLYMQGKNYGKVELDSQSGEGKLNEAQALGLIKAVQDAQPIVLKSDQMEWALSTAGASAVLLKMDDFQKRIGTVSALVRKGSRTDSSGLQTQPMPRVQIRDYQRGIVKRLKTGSAEAVRIQTLLYKTVSKDDCRIPFEHSYLPEDQLVIYPLNTKNVLVELPCWRGAYNYGFGYWVMDKPLKQARQLVTVSGSSFSDGQIFSMQKGRGIADCNTVDEWAWNGSSFVKTYQAVQAQCKGFVGGAWNMPVLIAKVQTAQ